MIRTIAAVVPAADEQALLDGCLAALRRSRAELARRHPGVRARVVVVLDSCTDDSARIAASAGVETVVISARRVGAARRAGADHVLRTATRAQTMWLANTDADSQVPADWLAGMVELADQGADLVLGTVRPDDGLSNSTLTAWYDGHVLADGHPHIHGANLGVRGSVYEAVGGWSALASGEDEQLAARAAAIPELSIARTARFPVTTSTRLHARAPYGFSSYLRRLPGEQCS
ncbi:MAG TPA: glycosyltransferase [Jatrophihabitantaceae bacterium]|nr:glycosyltransferase [Jatrophihabitantaceae bacterium]